MTGGQLETGGREKIRDIKEREREEISWKREGGHRYYARQSERDQEMRRISKTFRLHYDRVNDLDKIARAWNVSQARAIEQMIQMAQMARKSLVNGQAIQEAQEAIQEAQEAQARAIERIIQEARAREGEQMIQEVRKLARVGEQIKQEARMLARAGLPISGKRQ